MFFRILISAGNALRTRDNRCKKTFMNSLSLGIGVGSFIKCISITFFTDYHCGYPGNWSKTFSFKVMKEDTNWTARFAILGDMGTTNDRSLKWLISDVAQDMYDAVIHVGESESLALLLSVLWRVTLTF